jgi:hypothetical protein
VSPPTPWRRFVLPLACTGCMACSIIFATLAATERAVAAAEVKVLLARVDAAGRVMIRTRDGAAVTTVRRGSYTIVVRDESRRHNFHILGPDPSLARETGIKFVGRVRWNIELVPGVYRYYSDRRASVERSVHVTL